MHPGQYTVLNSPNEEVGTRTIDDDDKSYNVNDVLEIGTILNAPVIFDNLHNEINSCSKFKYDFIHCKCGMDFLMALPRHSTIHSTEVSLDLLTS